MLKCKVTNWWLLMFFFFSTLLNLLGWHWLAKLHRQVSGAQLHSTSSAPSPASQVSVRHLLRPIPSLPIPFLPRRSHTVVRVHELFLFFCFFVLCLHPLNTKFRVLMSNTLFKVQLCNSKLLRPHTAAYLCLCFYFHLSGTQQPYRIPIPWSNETVRKYDKYLKKLICYTIMCIIKYYEFNT